MRLLYSFRLERFTALFNGGFRYAEEGLHCSRELFESWFAFDRFCLHASIVNPAHIRELFYDVSPVFWGRITGRAFTRLRMTVQLLSLGTQASLDQVFRWHQGFRRNAYIDDRPQSCDPSGKTEQFDS